LINQTLKDIEIIVVNDGTQDDSQNIIDKYAKKDKRIIPLIKKNGGLGDARNFGIGHATGEYIGFVDADDYIDITMYEKMYNKAKEENSDLVECDFYWCYDKKMKLDKANYYDTLESIMTNIRVMVCNKIFKKNIIINNKITFPVGLRYEDILFTYKVLPYIKKVSHVEEGLY
jgi:glycosyltransferase involved in cell wall biosynthesis